MADFNPWDLAGSAVTGLFSLGQQAMANSYNRKEAEKNRQFQAEQADVNRVFQSNEAALQRDWSAQEAEIARDWQEEMYEKYNSLSGKIAQAEQAGVNPMYAITGNAVSPGSFSSSVPSGASAGSVGTPSGATAVGAFTDIVGKMLGFLQLKSQINLNEALANKANTDAEGQKITNEQLHDMNAAEIMSKLSNVEMNDANITLVASKILNTDADTKVKESQLGEVAARIRNLDADTDVKVKQLGVLAVQIIKDTKSLDVMTAQIAHMASEAGLNRERGKEIAQNVRNLVQEYGHNDVVNAFEEVISKAESDSANLWNSRNYGFLTGTIVEFMKYFKDLFNRN